MYKLFAFVLDLLRSAVTHIGAIASGLVIPSTTPQVGAGFAHNMKYPQSLLLSAALGLLAVSSANAQATFYGVGDLPGGGFASEIRDATKVGGVIYAVGSSAANPDNFNLGSGGGDTAILWTLTGGIIAIPNLVENTTGLGFVSGRAITRDGAFIAGSSRNNSSLHSGSRTAVRITTNGLTSLDLGSRHYSATNAISDDGSVLYGWTPNSDGSMRASRYTVSSPTGPTTIIVIPFLNTGDDSSLPAPKGSSSDGNIMLGNSNNSTVSGGGVTAPGNSAFIYNHTSVSVSGIPYLPGGSWNIGLAINPSGTLFLVGGDSTAHPNGELFLFDGSSTTPLGPPSDLVGWGGNFAGLTADGAVVAGAFWVAPGSQTSFVHNSSGWHDLPSAAAHAGANLVGWSQLVVMGISSDGTLLFGSGQHNGNTEGWVAEFPADYLRNYGDTTPPTITVPATITIDATSPAGAPLNYVVTATDTVDPYPTVNCAPATGSTFPMGTTVVNCTAIDASGNSATANFTVIVTAPLGQILNLIASVNSFNIAKGIANSLDAKLQNVFDALNAAKAGNLAAACNKIGAFINEVQAQAGQALTLAQANQFIAAANQVKASLGCP